MQSMPLVLSAKPIKTNQLNNLSGTNPKEIKTHPLGLDLVLKQTCKLLLRMRSSTHPIDYGERH
jgi:hypothetical protein